MTAEQQPDVAIVGAGIAGGALAFALARSGISVVLLEKSLEHVDRVRGEFIVPWGVAEARDLGVLEALEQAGGHYTTRSVPYGGQAGPEKAASMATPMGDLVPGVKGALNLAHPVVCDTLNWLAQNAGALLSRGIRDLALRPGDKPTISFTLRGDRVTLTPRLVIGADGRGSDVARLAGFRGRHDAIHHLLTGMLVDNAIGWPETDQTIGVDDDLGFYVFPQGGGKIRIYLAHGLEQKGRFSGGGGPARFIEALKRDCFPAGSNLDGAKPAGPCHGYANSEFRFEETMKPGVLLIGDAAGHSDPSGGQGISVAFKDARQVAEILRANQEWTVPAFADFLSERREQSRRISFSNDLLAKLRMEFSDAGRERGRRGAARMVKDRELALPFLALQKGPFSAPAEIFTPTIAQRLFE